MIIWGAVWGAVLGVLLRGHGNSEIEAILGAILGALAGWSLRTAVRREVARAPARQTAVPAAAMPMPMPMPMPERAAIPVPVAVAAPVAAPMSMPVPVASPAALRATPAVPAEPDFVTKLFLRGRDWLFGGNTVVRMGVLVLFVGLAFLAKYAVENALLPPQLRLAAIGAAGIALFVFGLRARNRSPQQRGFALTLQGAGVAVLYLTVFAAFRLYQYLPPAAAFGALGLICLFSTVIAIAQNALPLAFIGFAGGFAAPLLVSTGQGDHVGLFGYYLLLGVAITAIAWIKAWRPLNLLGFFATFGIATLWGVLRYQPENLESTEPFLIAFFLLYLLAALFYALRHGHGARKAVDATLLFGNPVVAFGLQAGLVKDVPHAAAFSSLSLGALYLALGWWLVRRKAGDRTVNQWLAECFAALSLGFITLAVPLALDGRWTCAVFAPAQRQVLHLLAWVFSAFALHHLALPRRAPSWPVAATPAWTVMPAMLLVALWGMATLDHVFQAEGWMAWALVLVMHGLMLHRLDAGPPQRWWPWVHAAGVWLLVLLLGNLLVFWIGRAQLWQTAWATVVLLAAASAVLMVLTTRRWFTAQAGTLRWPLDRFAPDYLWRAAAPLAVALAAGALMVAVYSSGEARPLPYVPLLNPTDLAVTLALAVITLWLVRVRRGNLPVPSGALGLAPPAVLAGIAFIAINTAWLRMAHHYGKVPWDSHSLFASFLVQAGFSILWSVLALVLMVGAHRRALRAPWMLGAALLGLTVLKLFVVDLSNRGGSERIVVFIAVGLLMLVVGWFAPLPPARPSLLAGDERLQGATP